MHCDVACLVRRDVVRYLVTLMDVRVASVEAPSASITLTRKVRLALGGSDVWP
jgi:hypothetical protein